MPGEGALAETKKKAVQVREKLVAAGEMREGIDEKREQYRPVATRGAVMYFTVVDLSLVNVMYQTSLDQFQTLFTRFLTRTIGIILAVCFTFQALATCRSRRKGALGRHGLERPHEQLVHPQGLVNSPVRFTFSVTMLPASFNDHDCT